MKERSGADARLMAARLCAHRKIVVCEFSYTPAGPSIIGRNQYSKLMDDGRCISVSGCIEAFQNHFLDVKLITEFVSIYRQINTSHSICDVLLQVQV